MDRLELYRIFSTVAELQSFTRTADQLQLPKSRVSAAIYSLESHIGARLLNRTTRRVSLTHEGEVFYRHCLGLLADNEKLESLFRTGNTVQGPIRVDVPGRMGRRLIAPRLPAFLAQYPDIRIELCLNDRNTDLVEERLDIALRVGHLPDSGLKARRIGEIRQINVASPDYLALHGTPASADDLDHHLQVAYAAPGTGRIYDWEWQEEGENRSRPVPWRVSANNAEAYIALARAGLGLIQIPAYDVAGLLARQSLVEVMPEQRPAPMPVHLVFLSRSSDRQRVSIFSDWLAETIASALSVETGP